MKIKSKENLVKTPKISILDLTRKIIFSGNAEDEASTQFLSLLDDPEISQELENAISIKVENGTVACNQFSAIYPVILVPSIYFIDSQSGVNIETTGGVVTKEKLMESLNKAKNSKNASSVTSPRNERVEQARQVIQSEGLDDSKSEATDPGTILVFLSISKP